MVSLNLLEGRTFYSLGQSESKCSTKFPPKERSRGPEGPRDPNYPIQSTHTSPNVICQYFWCSGLILNYMEGASISNISYNKVNFVKYFVALNLLALKVLLDYLRPVSSKSFDLLNSMIYDLKRSVDLR